MFSPLPRSDREELLDRADPDPRDLRDNLRDLRRVNLWGAGIRSMVRLLLRRIAAWPRERVLHILDVGTGGADLPRSLQAICRRRGIRCRIVGLDRSRLILEMARGRLGHCPGISLVEGDALAPPFRPGSFDFVLCSLLLHHIPPQRASSFLRGLASLAREGVLVSDLRRGRWEYFWTVLFSRLFLRGRMTLHDAPLSVLRSLTLPEAKALLTEAGWTGGGVEKSFPLRLILLDRTGR